MMIFAEVAPGATVSPDRGMASTLYMLVLLLVCMYFLIWRPEAKRRKGLDAKRSRMKKGDQLILANGIVAKFIRMEGANYLVQLYDGATMEILPMAIQEVRSTDEKKVSE